MSQTIIEVTDQDLAHLDQDQFDQVWEALAIVVWSRGLRTPPREAEDA